MSNAITIIVAIMPTSCATTKNSSAPSKKSPAPNQYPIPNRRNAVQDPIGETIISGVGGQHDFMYGAALSEGGKCFIALPSMTSKGQSKIVANLAPGAGVVTTRFQAQYIATEHGIVYLRNLPLAERAKALISIADPSVREELERAAVKRFGIGFLRLK